MDAGPLRDVLTALAGFFTGVLSGAFGVGGAVISTPAIRALGVPASIAIGTTLPSIFPSAAAGALRYRREALIDRRAVVLTVPVGLVASVVGAVLTEVIPGEGRLLMLLTAALLGFTAWRMVRDIPPKATGTRPGEPGDPALEPPTPVLPSRPAFALVGALAGLLSGLLGIGGGVAMVPGFTQLAGLSIKPAIATSLVCVAAFAVPGTITHAALGNIDWRVALLLALTVIPGARLGAAATVRATDRRIRQLVAAFLGIIALLYAGGELAALLS